MREVFGLDKHLRDET